jgi:hypothetical protein
MFSELGWQHSQCWQCAPRMLRSSVQRAPYSTINQNCAFHCFFKHAPCFQNPRQSLILMSLPCTMLLPCPARRTPWAPKFTSLPPNPGTAQQMAYLKAEAASAGPLLWPSRTLTLRRRCLRTRVTLRWRGRVGHGVKIPWAAPKVCVPHSFLGFYSVRTCHCGCP